VSPESVDRWSQIPGVPTTAFKELELSCLPPEQRTTAFHSSGTTGHTPSRHFHNQASLRIYEASLLCWFFTALHGSLLIADRTQRPPLGLAILTPPAEQAPHSSLVYMFDTIRKSMGAPPNAFVGEVQHDGAWALDLSAAVGRLENVAAGRQPVLLLGTAFSFVHLLDHLLEEDLQLELARGSCALETGGYKGRSRQLPKAQLHGLITERLGIARENIVCEYGMSELSSQAYNVADGVFQFPPWARAQVISPETGLDVAEGETGLIRVFDLANVYSVAAIQTGDLAVSHGNQFELLGRAALTEPRGCSLMVT
jgi:hypothetical protein